MCKAAAGCYHDKLCTFLIKNRVFMGDVDAKNARSPEPAILTKERYQPSERAISFELP